MTSDARPPASQPPPAQRILLVEDDDAHVEIVQRAFEDEGTAFQLTVANSLKEAYALLAHSTFDLIISDLNLPDGRGLELLPSNPEDLHTPFMLMTGQGSQQLAVQALKAGSLDYVIKSDATLTRMPALARHAIAEWTARVARRQAREQILDRKIELEGLVEERTAELRCANDELEKRVAERTADLNQTVAALEREGIERQRMEHVLGWEKHALKVLATSASLAEFLKDLALGLEGQATGALCSILLLDADGIHLRHGAAPSLPEDYNRLIDGVAIGPGVGSCGTAAYANRLVIVTDIATDPLWTNYRDLALGHGLRACWSTPVANSAGQVLGTFAIYYREPRSPSPAELDLVSRAQHLVGLAIERKQGEAALEKMRLSVDRAGDSIFWISREGRILYVNDAACTSRGYSRAELLSMKVFDLDPDYQPGIWGPHFEDLKRLGTLTLETCHRAKDGRMFPVEVNANYVFINGQEFNFAFLRDITVRKQAEAAQRVSDLALKAISQGVLITGPDSLICSANPAFLVITGYAETEVLGHSFRFLQGPESDPQTVAAIRLAIQQQQEFTGEILNYRKDGTPFWNELTISPIHDLRSGTLTHFIGITRDITERRQLEQQLRESQKMEAVGQLAGGIAHDFNNLLAVIQGYGTLLLAAPDSADAAESAQQIVQAAKRAADLTRQLLAFSRRQALQPRVLDLNEIVTGLSKMLGRVLGEDLRLVVNLDARVLLTRVDAGMLEQVLLNLAINARDAMPEGGQLEVVTGEVTLTAAEAGLLPDLAPGRHVWLRVTDTGCGILPEHLARIFEPFFTTKEVGKGTGLGLATVFGIVKQHGGAVTVASEVGRGTTFNIYLPATEAEVLSPVIKPAAPAAPGGGETILLVEDDPAVRKLTRRVLERAGYRVLEAADGVAGKRLGEEHSGVIRLLLTDIMMPEGVSGHALATHLEVKNPRLQVIFTSGYDVTAAGRGLSLREGEDFLQKPVSLSLLLATIRRSLDR